MESTAETIRIRTPTEVMAPACRRVSTRAKVPTSPSPWRRSGWPEPPSALHRHAAAERELLLSLLRRLGARIQAPADLGVGIRVVELVGPAVWDESSRG